MAKIGKYLLSPYAIITGIISGILIGLFAEKFAHNLAPIGRLYLDLLQMCILPIMITAVASSLGHLFQSEKVAQNVKRLIIVFIAGMLLTSALGLMLALMGQPGARLEKNSKTVLGKILSQSESKAESQSSPDIQTTQNPTTPSSFALINFASQTIPENIFEALSRGENLKILFFSIIFGISIAFVPKPLSQHFLNDCDAVFKAFETIILWIMYLLPFGLCFLLADQVSHVGIKVLTAMFKFIILIYLGSSLLIIFNALVIRYASGISFLHALAIFREPLIIALGTRNSFAAIPSALNVLSRKLSFEKKTVHLVIPLGITLCRFGTVMVFSLSTVFFAQLYEVPIHLQEIILILLGSVLAGMAAAGAPGVVAASMLALILEPLGLPVGAGIILFLAIDPITDPILTVVNVYSNCSATALITRSSFSTVYRKI
jgi:proton glutamate symport protein